MMRTPSKKSIRQASALAANLMLAPAVVTLRLPLLADEARDLNPWRVETMRAVSEKAAAMVEGAVAAQLSLAQSTSRFWLEVMAGKTPSIWNGVALERAMHAALKPSGTQVRTNYKRLRVR